MNQYFELFGKESVIECEKNIACYNVIYQMIYTKELKSTLRQFYTYYHEFVNSKSLNREI